MSRPNILVAPPIEFARGLRLYGGDQDAILVRLVLQFLNDGDERFRTTTEALKSTFPYLVQKSFSTLWRAEFSEREAEGLKQRRGLSGRSARAHRGAFALLGIGRYLGSLRSICVDYGLKVKQPLHWPEWSWDEYLHCFLGDHPVITASDPRLDPPLGLPSLVDRSRGRPHDTTRTRREKERKLACAIGMRLAGKPWSQVTDALEQLVEDYDPQRLQTEARRLAKRLEIDLGAAKTGRSN